jgi:4'-phosphopantetheinyl transferase
MIPVYWLDQRWTDMRVPLDWLSPAERASLARLQVPKRRSDWLLGRWAAKQAVVSTLHLDSAPETLASIELPPGPDGAPVLRVGGNRAPVTASISHSAGLALAAVAPAGTALGCDLERVESHSVGFVSDYFSVAEQGAISQLPDAARDQFISLLWSAKESVLKLLHCGLRLDTRSVSVRVKDALAPGSDDAWQAFDGLFVSGAMFRGWWQSTGTVVRTVAAFPPPMRPVRLNPTEVDFGRLQILPFGKMRRLEACSR